MSVERAIRRAVPVLAERAGYDPGVLAGWLILAGLTKQEAHDAQRFIPLAFGREVLNGTGVTLPDTYVRADANGQQERALKDEPFYTEAMRLAPAIASELGMEVFSAVAFQSAELHAVNNALNAGSQPEDLVAGAPLIECEIFEEPPRARPWWKFW